MQAGMIPRRLAAKVAEALADTRVVVLAGPRQAGKTTLMRELCASSGRPLRSLDDESNLLAARRDPKGFVQGPGPIAIDEIQRAPSLLLAIKQIVDEDPRPGRFLLSGSANLMTLPVVADSLAGRMEVQNLLPLAQCELSGRGADWLDAAFGGDPGSSPLPPDASETPLTTRILSGGYPEAIARPSARRRTDWFLAYVEALISRDVRELAQVHQIDQLGRFLRALAATSGNLCNYSKLGSELGLDHKTAARYVGLFEQMFLVRRLEPWSGNALSRLVKTPKLHFLDSGLLAALSGVTAERLNRDRTPLGALTETFVLAELLKLATWSEGHYRFSHYRDKDQREVDIVIENTASELVGVEVKAGASVVEADLAGLKRLAGVVGRSFRAGIVLYDGVAKLSLGGGLWALPFRTLWTG